MPDRRVIAYLTSQYARASDSFIRQEVQELRAMGHTVHTFSVRRAAQNELVSEAIKKEHASTEFLLDNNLPRLFFSSLKLALFAPLKMGRALSLTLSAAEPHLKSRLRHIAYLAEAAYLAERLRKKGVQHLHNHIAEGSATVAMLASLISGVPYSLTLHGPGEFDRASTLALAEKLRRCKFAAVISDFTRSQLYRWVDFMDWQKIHIVRCGVDKSFLSEAGQPIGGDPYLICVGRLCEQKGQLLLVEAAARLMAERIPFKICLIGDGPMRDMLERRIADLGLRQVVRITGWMSQDDIRSEILKSRAMVLPSFAEGLPVVIMESLALRRPVVSTYIAGIPELVKPGVSGWLVPAGSVDALAQAMREVLKTPAETLDRMGEAGAQSVRERHDATTEAKKLERLICG